MEKYKKIREIIDTMETADLPSGNTMVYIGDEHIDLYSNINDGIEASDAIEGIMTAANQIIMDILEQLPEEESIIEAVDHFIDLYKTILLNHISNEPDLFIKYLEDASNMIAEQELDEPMKIKTKDYN